MRLIDADALIENHFSPSHRIALSYADKQWMRKIIGESPTVDAVPVIRCKDCIHFDADADACDRWLEDTLSYWISAQPDGFCWAAERNDL